MRNIFFILLLTCSVTIFAQTDSKSQEVREKEHNERYEAQEAGFKTLAWQKGPTVGRIGDMATITVPEGYVFLDSENTRRFLELTQNIPADGAYLIAPDTGKWFSIFMFDDFGYVEDDETIDTESILEGLKAFNVINT